MSGAISWASDSAMDCMLGGEPSHKVGKSCILAVAGHVGTGPLRALAWVLSYSVLCVLKRAVIPHASMRLGFGARSGDRAMPADNNKSSFR